MKSHNAPGVLIILILLLVCSQARSQKSSVIELKKVIPLPNVAGRIDHMDIDLKTGRVFVAALGNNTVEVVSLREGKVLRTLKGFSEPQGVLFLQASNRLFVTNGGDGTCAVLDGASFERVRTVSNLDDADNIRYSQSEKLIYVAYGKGGVAAIDPARAEILYRLPLSAHPESFQLESAGTRIYVNVPGDRKIIVLDRAKQQAVATWQLKDAESNFPMAFDETRHRLFIGCRAPALLLILDVLSGSTISTLPIGGDVDDVFFDASRHRLYVSCGEGIVDVVSQQDSNTYKMISKLVTRKGARTSLFIPQTGTLLVAVPRFGDADAELRVYLLTGE